MKISEQSKKYFWTGGGMGIFLAVALLGGRYLAAQEAEKVVAPVRAEQITTTKAIADMRFEKRYDEAQVALAECREQGHVEAYCAAQDEWRWEVHYEYLNCIAGLEYADREDACGPVPVFVPPEGVEP
jgi:hypothetical protein